MLKCYMEPVILYACETFTMNRQVEKYLLAVKLWFLRKIQRYYGQTGNRMCQSFKKRENRVCECVRACMCVNVVESDTVMGPRRRPKTSITLLPVEMGCLTCLSGVGHLSVRGWRSVCEGWAFCL